MQGRIRMVYFLFTVIGLVSAVLLVITIYYQRRVTKEFGGDFCAYLEKIEVINSKSDVALTVMLLIVVTTNISAYCLFRRTVHKYFNSALTLERRQLNIVFGVFSGVAIVTMIVFLLIGFWGTLVLNITVRWFLKNCFTVFTDFPIILILYFHHVNYRLE
jgi:hypothetical protein